MRREPLRQLALLLLISLAEAGSARGQGTTSRVTGTVFDQSRAALPGATVTLTNEATQVSFNTTTTSAGSYVFDSVQVGSYTIAVEMPGFKKFVSRGNFLAINQPTTLNATLEVGGLAEVVEVQESATPVQLSSSGNFGNNLDQRTIQALPIVGIRGRNPLNFVLFQPGVVEGANTGGGVHVHGARDRAWNYTLDGIDTNDTSAGGSNFSPLRTNPDSLAEYQVVTSNFTAEFGRNSGGQVTMVTRSGTNEFHGGLFEFYQTPRFHANEFENNLNRLPKRQFVQHVAGGTLGGPIRKNKTFFFANLQVLRTSESRVVNSLVYTAEARRGLFRYAAGGRNAPAGAPGASVDANGNPLPGLSMGTYDIVAGDPEGRGLDPEVQRILGLTPLPNDFTMGDGLNVAAFTFSAQQREKQYDGVLRIDHIINERNSIFVRYAQGEQNTLGDAVNGGLQRFPDGPRFVDTFRNPQNLAVNWRTTPGSRVTNELVVGFNRFGFSFNNPDPDFAKNPPFTLNNVTDPLNNTTTVNNARKLRTYQLVDNLTFVTGAHTIKSGINFRYSQHIDDRSSVAGLNIVPSVTFSRTINTVDPLRFGLPTNINTAFDRPRLEGTINDLLGRVGSISQAFVATSDTQYGPPGTRFNYDARYGEYDVYAQDVWRVRPGLVVDAGLRWEVRISPRAPDNQVLRPERRIAVGEAPGNTLRWVRGKLFDDDWNNFGPVLGVAWDPFGSGKTSVRANYRLAYDRMNTFVLSSTIFQSAPGATLGVINSEFGQSGGRLGNLPALTPPPGLAPEQLRQPAAFSTNSIHVVDPEMGSPRTHMWGLSVQREVGWHSVVEVNYIGRKGEHLFGGYDANQVDIFNNGFLDAFNLVRGGSESALVNTLMARDSRLRPGETGSQAMRRLFASELTLGSVGAVAANLAQRTERGVPLVVLAGVGPFFFQPFPQFAGALNVLDNNDRSRYNALEIQFKRRFRNGLGFQIGYTLAKSEDTRSFDPTFSTVSRGALQSASSSPFDIHNRDLNFARSDFDRRHVLQGSWVWELPVGPGRHWLREGVLAQVLGGWETAGIVRWMSGRPFTAYSGANTLSNVNQSPAECTGCTPGMVRRVLNPDAGTEFYFDPQQRSLFAQPVPGRIGNTGRNFFTMPSFFEIDAVLGKKVGITRDQNLELRVEIQNLTNHPSFGLPNSAIITSSLFGRARGNVDSSSRKVQLAVKYNF